MIVEKNNRFYIVGITKGIISSISTFESMVDTNNATWIKSILAKSTSDAD